MQQGAVPAHRPDIDGLRAVAILTVLAFHGWEQYFPSGFIGVDIFFVISGFLISSIIFRGLQQGRFSFLDFYLRRIKRIFPALLLVLVTVWTAGWLLLLPDEFMRTGKHIATGAAFTANLALWTEAGYFDWSAELKPLLHLWSLGVEEQFYIGWPLLAWLAYRWRWNLLLIALGIALVSFVINVAMIEKYHTAVFYLPVTRIWEILLGTALAWLTAFRPQALAHAARHANGLAFAGLGLLVIALTSLERSSSFPGWWALLPTVGTALLIAAPGAWLNRHVLSSRPLVFIGLISYPLYLWHWPLLSLLRITNRATHVTIALALASAFVLAWITWHWVERPIRSRHPGKVPATLLSAGVAAMGIAGLAGFLALIQPRSIHTPGIDALVAAATTQAFPGPNLRAQEARYDTFHQQGTSARTVLFIGDSNMQQYYPRVDRLLTEHAQTAPSAVFATLGGCPPFPAAREDHHLYCSGFLERTLAYARRPEVESIVLAAAWLGYFEAQRRYDWYVSADGKRESMLLGHAGVAKAFDSLEQYLVELKALGKPLYLVLPMPTGVQFDPRRMVQRQLRSPAFEIEAPVVTRAEIERQNAPVTARLKQIASKHAIRTIDPTASLCPKRVCAARTAQGMPVYQDARHLNPHYVREEVRYLDAILLRPPGKPQELVSLR